jgi:hypothetical protein
MKKELKERDENLYLGDNPAHFLLKEILHANGWAQPFENPKEYFVAILEQNEKGIKRNE